MSGIPPLKEVVEGLHHNPLFKALLAHLYKRQDSRIRAAIGARDDVDVLRGRAQEMMDLMKDLERKDG